MLTNLVSGTLKYSLKVTYSDSVPDTNFLFFIIVPTSCTYNGHFLIIVLYCIIMPIGCKVGSDLRFLYLDFIGLVSFNV